MCVVVEEITSTREKPKSHSIPGFPLFGETHFIVNPVSAAGRTEKRWFRLLQYLRDHWPGSFTYSLTAYPGQATRLARLAAQNGCRNLVVMGGDGTLQEVVNGLFASDASISREVRLGILNSGTGQGLARSLALPETLLAQLDLIRRGITRRIDLVRVRYTGSNGETHSRVYVNECQIGLGARVVQRLSTHAKRLGGKLAFGLTALSTALEQPVQPLTLVLDEKPPLHLPLLGVVVANGALTGGGMQLTPTARLDDGLLDVLLIHQQSLPRRLRNFPKIYSGRHLTTAGFSLYRTKKIVITGQIRVPVAADGEFLGTLPCTIEILPRALTVFAPQEGGQR